jgi:6-pyruvoyltetrahydropterin/6-carboxytetrahydropterin synthase
LYRIFIETHFAASHQLHGYQGLCKDLHGHTWKVRVEVETNETNDIGISFDFKELKAITQSVIQRLDHHHINDVEPFDKENPTAENLARYIFVEIKTLLPSSVRIHQVTVWESAYYAVSYSED